MSYAKISRRIRRCGGTSKFIDMKLRNNYKPFWDFMQKEGTLRAKWMNSIWTVLLLRRWIKTVPRVNKYTLKDDYASFESIIVPLARASLFALSSNISDSINIEDSKSSIP